MKIDNTVLFFLHLKALIFLGIGLRLGGQCTQVYYVLPANDPPNCPGEPCQPLDAYMESIDHYFGSDKVNITMEFLPGIHTSDQDDMPIISGLEKFEMEGIESPGGVFVCFSVWFTDIKQVSMKTLTFSAGWGCSSPRLLFVNISTVVIKSVRGGPDTSNAMTTDVNSFDDIIDCLTYPFKNTIAISGEDCPIVITAYNNITITGNTTFANKHETALTAYASTVTLSSGNVSFISNIGTKGGAMALYSSTLNIARNTSIYFNRNKAREVGGAIYISTTYNPYEEDCFYQLLNYTNSSGAYSLVFDANTAERGGDHIYGVNMKANCSVAYYRQSLIGWIGETIRSYQAMKYFFTFITGSVSSISSDPRGICMCGTSGRPQCANSISDIYLNYSVSAGETFTLSVVIVGGSFGTTTGIVYADFLPLRNSNQGAPSLKDNYEHVQWITNHTKCFELQYTVYSRNNWELLYLTSTSASQSRVREALGKKKELAMDIASYKRAGSISNILLTTPIFVNVTLLPCPLGFSLQGNPPRCDCCLSTAYQLIDAYDINCSAFGIISWNAQLWIGVQKETETLDINYQCPSGYCELGTKTAYFQNNTAADSQCAFNRAGRLCGGCKDNYSLAIGSSHCIHCPNNNSLSLLIFFAAAGFLLVFFISALNLTVTQGWINGLIFYANIIWAYQGILFHDEIKQNAFTLFGRTFIAWLNLDFGIETCFFNGLNAFWKTYLQYVFPFYTAGLFTIGLRYSSNLSKLFGNRSVPTLATLLFLSYTKLLRTIITSLELAHLTNCPSNLTRYVWSIDGRLDYGHFPHITLLLAAIASLLLLWLPYTMLLFLMQWLRRISYAKASKWITRYKPVIDAYFAPLKDRHHYWFGVLLLTRGILLLTSSLTANINPAVSLFMLLVVATLLLCYMNYQQVYKRKSVLILEGAFLINLLFLTGGTMYYYRDVGGGQRAILVHISIGIAFVKFCGIIICSLLQLLSRCKSRRQSSSISHSGNITNSKETNASVPRGEVSIQDSCQFRDSILEDGPLFHKKLPTY